VLPLSRLLLLEWIPLVHADAAKLVMGIFRNEVVEYRDFSAAVTQDVIAAGLAVAGELISKKRNPQGAKLFRTDLLLGAA
jgi:hypothetical protein